MSEPLCLDGCTLQGNGTHVWTNHVPGCRFYKGKQHVAVAPARQQGKTLALARRRVRAVAEGRTINGTYKLSPEPALEAFRADLLLILG